MRALHRLRSWMTGFGGMLLSPENYLARVRKPVEFDRHCYARFGEQLQKMLQEESRLFTILRSDEAFLLDVVPRYNSDILIGVFTTLHQRDRADYQPEHEIDQYIPVYCPELIPGGQFRYLLANDTIEAVTRYTPPVFYRAEHPEFVFRLTDPEHRLPLSELPHYRSTEVCT